MAGSLPGIANTQRVDGQGQPLVGGKLYLYNAGTVIPASAFKDFNLTTGQEQPFPIVLDAFGQIPAFYLADGFYRARLTNASGSTVLFDIAQVPAVGNETSGGGTPPTIDPTTIFNTGDFDWQPRSGSRTGWVRANARTIGNASSGASERASNDCETLFTFNWNTYDDTRCPVVGGRGASAAADWTAAKQITLLDLRFIIPVGLDDMGNTAAGKAAAAPVVSGSGTAAASVLGALTNTLARNNLPNATLTVAASGSVTVTSTRDDIDVSTNGISVSAGSVATIGATAAITSTGTASVTGTTSSINGNVTQQAFNNTPLVMTGTYYQKI